MGLYERWILPRLIDLAMRNEDLVAYRKRVVAKARGRVLEIGIGSGLNLPFYSTAVEQIVGVDPSAELLARTRRLGAQSHCPVSLIQASAEAIPIRDRTVDTVVMTWTLCSIPDAQKAMTEMHRVLAPGGQLLFVEHGLASETNIRKWQHWLDPIWGRVSCHLDRPTDQLIRQGGGRISALRTGYLARGPKVMTFLYEGEAQPV